MNGATLQIPLSKNLRSAIQEDALASGFSSLQEAIATLLKKIASKSFSFSMLKKKESWYEEEILTPKEAAYLDKRVEEIEEARKKGEVFTAHSVEEMMQYLDS